MSITVREACSRFLEEIDEVVPQEPLERYMRALEGLVVYLEEAGIDTLDRLSPARIDEYLALYDAKSTTDARDVQHAVKRFLGWLLRRQRKRPTDPSGDYDLAPRGPSP